MSAPTIQLDLNNLPSDPSLLLQLVHDLVSTLQNQKHQIEKLNHQLKQLQRYQFGAKSERLAALEGQLLFEFLNLLKAGAEAEEVEDDKLVEQAQEEEIEDAPEENGKKKKGHGRAALPDHLPRRRMEFSLPEEELGCPCCAGTMEKIGEVTTQQLEYVPASFHVRELVRFKYACKKCQEGIRISDLPPQPIEKGLPGPGLLAHVLTSKYADHLPLNRQEGIFQRNGVEISRKTLCDWVGGSSRLLEPIVAEMKKDLRGSEKIHTDDTPVPVLDKNRTRTRQGRLWIYANEEHLVYDYTPDRSRDGPKRFLNGYRGYLQADAYAGYDAIYKSGRVIEVGCWAHARRKFVEAQETDPLRAHVALVYIGRLYGVEKQTRDLEPKDRQARRQEESGPILEDFKTWLETEAGAVLPKSPMGQAITYTLNQWTALVRYIEDGDLAIDNNLAERALRRVVIGRKNYLFCGSDSGGKRAAIIYSLIASCKAHDIDPFEYLRDVMERLPSHPINRIRELLPKNWKAARLASVN